jgi:predicted ATPase
MLAEAMCDAGEIQEGLAVVDEGLARCEAHEDRWCISELLRVKGRLAWAKGSIATAEENFREASAWARRQGALSWELRAVTCQAQLRYQSGKAAEACELLSSVYDRFTEGYDTSDLRTAGAWIGTLRPQPD